LSPFFSLPEQEKQNTLQEHKKIDDIPKANIQELQQALKEQSTAD